MDKDELTRIIGLLPAPDDRRCYKHEYVRACSWDKTRSVMRRCTLVPDHLGDHVWSEEFITEPRPEPPPAYMPPPPTLTPTLEPNGEIVHELRNGAGQVVQRYTSSGAGAIHSDRCWCGHLQHWHTRPNTDSHECRFHIGDGVECSCTSFHPSELLGDLGS